LKERIRIMTAHKSKGDESDYVFLLWHGENWLRVHPNTKFGVIFWDTDASVLAEERRLYYVAMTRAKKGIFFLSQRELLDINMPQKIYRALSQWQETYPNNISYKNPDDIDIQDIPF
jgi:DNA helicase-4